MSEPKVFHLLVLKVGSPKPTAAQFAGGMPFGQFEDAIAAAVGYNPTKLDAWIAADHLLFEPGHISVIYKYMQSSARKASDAHRT